MLPWQNTTISISEIKKRGEQRSSKCTKCISGCAERPLFQIAGKAPVMQWFESLFMRPGYGADKAPSTSMHSESVTGFRGPNYVISPHSQDIYKATIRFDGQWLHSGKLIGTSIRPLDGETISKWLYLQAGREPSKQANTEIFDRGLWREKHLVRWRNRMGRDSSKPGEGPHRWKVPRMWDSLKTAKSRPII